MYRFKYFIHLACFASSTPFQKKVVKSVLKKELDRIGGGEKVRSIFHQFSIVYTSVEKVSLLYRTWYFTACKQQHYFQLLFPIVLVCMCTYLTKEFWRIFFLNIKEIQLCAQHHDLCCCNVDYPKLAYVRRYFVQTKSCESGFSYTFHPLEICIALRLVWSMFVP